MENSDNITQPNENRYVKEFLESPFYAVFIVHRRVMTVLYKTYGLRGYAIELMLMIGYLCKFRMGTEVNGGEIRKRCSYKFQRQLHTMIPDLAERGFIEWGRYSDRPKSEHKISLTKEGLEFIQHWEQEIKSLVQTERDYLILNLHKSKTDKKLGKNSGAEK